MYNDRFLKEQSERNFLTDQYGLMPPLRVKIMSEEERRDIHSFPLNTNETQEKLINAWELGGMVLASFTVDYNREEEKEIFHQVGKLKLGEEALLALATLFRDDEKWEWLLKLAPEFDLQLIRPEVNGLFLVSDLNSGKFYIIMVPALGVSVSETEFVDHENLNWSGQYTIVRDYIEYLAETLSGLTKAQYELLLSAIDNIPPSRQSSEQFEEIQLRAQKRLRDALRED